jgi:biotin-(acetyl-CoA carboxylase) ligase
MTERLVAKEQISPFSLLFAASLVVHPQASPDMQLELMDLVAKTAQVDVLKAISLLPVLIYKLGKSQDPNVQIKVPNLTIALRY